MGGGAVAVSSGNAAFAHLVDPRPWYKNSRLIQLNLCICLLLITSSTNGYDGSMMNGLQLLPQWNKDFNTPSGGQLGLLNAIQQIGSLSAFPFAPYVSDGLGRRTSILLGASIMIGASFLQAFSRSVGMFIGARFLIGFGLNFAHLAAPLLVSEVAYPTQRAQLTSLYNTLWYLGAIIAAWTTFGTFQLQTGWSWRIPSALQCVPSVLQLFLIWFVPESPRWLLSKGKDEKALNILAYYHARGNKSDPLVQYEYEEIKAALALDREIAANVGWTTLFRTPGNRRRMRVILAIGFFSQWSGNGLSSLRLDHITSERCSVLLESPTPQPSYSSQNGVLHIYNLIVAIIAGFLCERVGRRPLFIISTVGMLVFWTVISICFRYASDGISAAGRAAVAAIFLYYGFYDLAYTPLIVSYTVEILPYRLRAKGFTLFNFAISLSLIFNQYVNPIAMDKIGWKYFLVYVAWLALETVFVFLYVVETKNRSLEETAALFDGEDKVAELAQKTAGGHVPHDDDEKISPRESM
ncbi:hypothetical protein AX16_009966 [Volvariella volvacea WC 439]|nr:hypothetical protein AX16_009966 [Volvariella volvacea WC 439]